MAEPKITYKLDGLTEVMEWELKNLVEKNMTWKMSSCLKKIWDVEVSLKIGVTKVSQWYDWNFQFDYNWETLDYAREWFTILSDLVNHAFDNFKERILWK